MFGAGSTGIRKHHQLGAVAVGGVVLAAGVLIQATPASASDGTATVTLSTDGVTTTVTTSASNVTQLLTQQSVPYDSTDLVEPGLNASVVDGMRVSWTPATRVVVRNNGERTAKLVTGKTARSVKNELGLPQGLNNTLRRTRAYSYKEGRLYTPQGRELKGGDGVAENSIAVIHTFRVAFPDDRKRIERKVVRDRSKLVRSGGKRVFQQGHTGVKRVVYRKKYMDGRLVAKRVVASKVVRHAKRKVVRIGTGPNWIGLARCESGRNPNAVNPAGYYGLYQFSLSTWRSVGGRGNPTDYGYWEQTKRAWKLFKREGRSPWPVCGRYL